MEVYADFHLLRKDSECVVLEKRISNSLNRLQIEFLAEME